MKDAPFYLDFNKEEDSLYLKDIIYKYLRYWPWLLIVILLFVGLAYTYTRITPTRYETIAKVKIIDDTKESNIASDAIMISGNQKNINLENEIEVLKSSRLLQQVVSDLHLDHELYWEGKVKTTMIWNSPFIITNNLIEDSIQEPLTYQIALRPNAMEITDEYNKITSIPFLKVDSIATGLPFHISLKDRASIVDFEDVHFKLVVLSNKEALTKLMESLEVVPTDQNSDILSLSLEGQSTGRSEAILNKLIEIYDRDGILDRQLVSRRTLEVIDKRFVYLSQELDSIEIGKQDFKQSNNLSYIEADASLTMQRKSETEDEVLELENQIALSDLLKETVVNQAEYSLLPADLGLQNSGLNSMVSDYNELALERAKMLPTMGVNHPALQAVSEQLERGKVNIIKTVNNYQTQLQTSLNRLVREKNVAGAMFSRLPEKEKTLRAIERQQSIKEQLFLILLQKREEAAINLAATVPSIKVIDYAITNPEPVAPKKLMVYPLSLALGMFLPFVVLYIRFALDTRINNREDLELLKDEIPILAEIPFFKGTKSFRGFDDRSVLAESFRILGTNIDYLLQKHRTDSGKVVFVTSAIKGEGKTLVALNLSLSYASLKKRVLLVGADLRNPEVNAYVADHKNYNGLVDYLVKPGLDWKECIHEGAEHSEYHHICFSGHIPANAPELLSGKRFGEFIGKAVTEFDYVIVDTAPTLVVTDTLLISRYADLTLMVTRVGFTEKKLLKYIKELHHSGKLEKMALVLNEAGFGNKNDYNYGYGYGYGPDKESV